MTSKQAISRLNELMACREAVSWCRGREVDEAWRDCERGDWMLWLCGKLPASNSYNERKRLVLCACECARLALPKVPSGEKRPRLAIETAESWARGNGTTIKQVRCAAEEAKDASAASAADYAASAADYAASAADYAAYAASAASAAASAASAAEHAQATVLRETAAIVRKHYPICPLLEANP